MPTLSHMLSLEWTLIMRIAAALVLGALVGMERDLHGRPAGLRTNMIIAAGACLFAILSREGFADASGTQDPTRIASIVVQGIGFIGAGVMLKGDKKVLGLTTAATIWLSAAVGVAAGSGMIALAAFVTIVSIILLFALDPLSNTLEEIGRRRVERQGGEVVKEE